MSSNSISTKDKSQSPSQNDEAEQASASTLPGKTKLSALARFKMFTTGESKPAAPPFPPPSWELSESPQSGSGASDWDQKAEHYKAGLDRWREEVNAITLQEEAEKKKAEAEVIKKDDESTEQTADQDVPDTRTLAMKIKSLIDEKFTFGAGQSTSSSEANRSGTATPNGTASSSSPSMFGGLDARLAKLLSSETIMNGEVGKGLEKSRESVWAVLDKIGDIAGAAGSAPRKVPSSSSGTAVDKGKEKAAEQNHPTTDVEDDGIMLYTPLQPTKDLEPEIAESELEYIDDDEQMVGSRSTTPTPIRPPAEPASPAAPQVDKKPAPKPKTKRTFYPSSTQMSLQVTWWGYRLFLPPPIIAQLSSAHIAAAKRGAMITAALKWLIDQVPLMVIPPTMRPGVLMLKRVSPFLGYVGAFVAWSWTRVQAKDEGQGVVLTATWLLPVAILPASWDFEVHGRPRDAAGIESAGRNPQGTIAGEQSRASSSAPANAENQSADSSATPAATSSATSLLSSVSRRWNSLGRTSSNKKTAE